MNPSKYPRPVRSKEFLINSSRIQNQAEVIFIATDLINSFYDDGLNNRNCNIATWDEFERYAIEHGERPSALMREFGAHLVNIIAKVYMQGRSDAAGRYN